MNHIYRVVYNAATNTYQAVPENSTGKHKTASEKSSCAVSDVSEKGAFFALKPIALCAMAMGLSSTGAWAAPTGGHISAGDASIAQHGKITNIQQNSQKAAINWQTFGIKADETVNFKQPNAQAVILNRVIGNEKSVIDGAMNANGKVFISNPNGMIIGKNAQINVGALLATTAKIKDQDFMNGFFKFDQATGDITQLGDIKVPTGGVVALIAPIVANKGNITAPQGKVLLASAEQFSITLPDNGQFAYTLDRGTLQGLVDNGGAILADGGHVILTAKGTDTVKKSLIKHTGKIEANTVQNKNGVIELLGDLDNTRLEASGSLKAEAEHGDGGFIETSAAELGINDLQVSTQSKYGKTGTWLIDPKDFIVAPSGGDMTGAAVSAGLQSNDMVLKSRDGAKEGKGDVIINDEISWNKNTLTLNAESDIHINKTLNGKGTAKLALEYGQGESDGGESDYHIKMGTKVNLPAGKTLITQKGSNGENLEFNVMHRMPNIHLDGSTNDFSSQYIALGQDVDIGDTKRFSSFLGYTPSQNFYFHGLGHTVNNLTIKTTDEHIKNVNEYNASINAGLFTNLNSGEIRDITLKNSNIQIQSDNHSFSVGGLVGNIVSGNIKNIHTDSNSIEIKTQGGAIVGGIIGRARHGQFELLTSNSNLLAKSENHHSTIGGIIGQNSTGTTYFKNTLNQSLFNGIISSESKGRIAQDSSNSGGIVGYSDGLDIKDSYFNGIINNKDTNNKYSKSGGIIGFGLRSGIKNSYVSGKIVDDNNTENIGALAGVLYSDSEIYSSFYNKETINTYPAVGSNISAYDLSGRTTVEMQEQATFTDWDFDNIWYMNEGSMPKLRAFATPLAVAPTTPTLNAPTDKAQAGVKAPDLSKPYDGKKIENVEALKQLDGWKDNFDATGLTNGDTVENIFQPNTLTIDETRGDWKGAKDVKEGGYELYPTGTLKDEYQQKYIIEWNKGVLTINPAKLTITAMNNIKPEGENNPDVSRIGVVVTGLVNGEQISDVNLSYSDDKKWQGDISIIRVGEPVFSNGKASNYEITKNHGKLLTVQKEYDVKNITDKKPEDVITILRQLGAVKDDGTIDISEIEDRALLAHAVYGNGVDENTNSPKRWYEIWEVKHKGSNIITKEMKELGFDPSKENDGNTYTKLYELIDSKDTYIGTQYQVEIIKYGLGTPEYRLVTPKEYDDLVKLYGKDKVYKKKEFKDGTYSDTEPNGLNIGVYRNTNSNKNFIVFRGTDSMNAYDFFGKDGFEDSDGETNARQVDGKLPPQYKEAKNFVKTLITNNPNTNYEIVGHSLGGGLASYASISQDKPINTTVFNQALLHFNNIPNINNRKPSKPIFDGRELYDYAKTFNQVHSFVFDDDIVSNGDKATLTHIGNVEGIRLLPNKINTDWFDKKIEAYENRVADHQMTHVRKTIYLADTMAKNNEMLANCQSYDCQVLRQNRWTPSSSNLEKIDNKRANTINKLTNEQNQVHQQISELEKQGKNSERKQRDLDKINQKLDKAVQAEVKSNNITVIRGNDIFSVKKNNGWTFQKGDIINTGNKKATIYFPDGSWVELDKDTSIEITIEYNPSVQLNKPIASYIALIKGKILKEGTKQ